MVSVDTTSVFFYRDGVSELVRHGYSRDRRPDLPQLILCVAVDGQGWPVAFDILPGNTADTAALTQTIARFRERFRIRCSHRSSCGERGCSQTLSVGDMAR
jgi:transposase